ncbi:hypothetical protein NX059_003093 [Plenodomus lindquistii]|nr:hypothetical protein NX059_003093 [Plenodomus lindquistii]
MSTTNETNSTSTPSAPSLANRPWTVEEEARVVYLHNVEGKTYKVIAEILGRTKYAVTSKVTAMRTQTSKPRPVLPTYDKRPEQTYSTIYWTPEIDNALIEGHRIRLPNAKIALSLHLPRGAVQERWAYLLANCLIPPDVLALDGRRNPKPRMKKPMVFTREEDEAIWALWLAMKNDDEIAKIMQEHFGGKAVTTIKNRRALLTQVPGSYQKWAGGIGEARGEVWMGGVGG